MLSLKLDTATLVHYCLAVECSTEETFLDVIKYTIHQVEIMNYFSFNPYNKQTFSTFSCHSTFIYFTHMQYNL